MIGDAFVGKELLDLFEVCAQDYGVLRGLKKSEDVYLRAKNAGHLCGRADFLT